MRASCFEELATLLRQHWVCIFIGLPRSPFSTFSLLSRDATCVKMTQYHFFPQVAKNKPEPEPSSKNKKKLRGLDN